MLVLCVWLCIPEPSVGGSGVGVILMPVTKYQKFRWSRLPHSLSAQEALALPVGGGEEVSGVLPVGGIALVLHTPGLELHCTPSNWTKLRHVGHPAHSSPSAPWRVFWILRCPFLVSSASGRAFLQEGNALEQVQSCSEFRKPLHSVIPSKPFFKHRPTPPNANRQLNSTCIQWHHHSCILRQCDFSSSHGVP